MLAYLQGSFALENRMHRLQYLVDCLEVHRWLRRRDTLNSPLQALCWPERPSSGSSGPHAA
jgi:hypothetical protein